jgi:hypothetical protein
MSRFVVLVADVQKEKDVVAHRDTYLVTHGYTIDEVRLSETPYAAVLLLNSDQIEAEARLLCSRVHHLRVDAAKTTPAPTRRQSTLGKRVRNGRG